MRIGVVCFFRENKSSLSEDMQMYSACLSENKSSLYVFVKRGVSVCLSKNGRSLCV